MFGFLCCCKTKSKSIKPLFRDVSVKSPVPSSNSQVLEKAVFLHNRSKTCIEMKRRSVKNLSSVPRRPKVSHPLRDYVYPRTCIDE